MLGKRQSSSESPAKQARQDTADGKPPALTGGREMTFLSACALCGKGLGPGKDTYIYKGEVAFCSPECREQYIKLERMAKKNSTKNISS